MPNSPESERRDAGAGMSPQPDEQPGLQRRSERDAAVEQLRAEVVQLEDRWKRALADLDNYRKRSAAEVERRVGETRERLLGDWLEVVDSVERALWMGHREGSEGEGLRAVLQQMETVLARHGLRRVGAAGEPFDPERHEAIGVRETDDAPDRTVVEVARSGWAVGDRVLRPAQVLVARPRAAVRQLGQERADG